LVSRLVNDANLIFVDNYNFPNGS
jgi:hypothetical protein